MKVKLKIIILCGIILMAAFSCKKENPGPETIEALVKLVNENDVVIDTFGKGDSVLFKFYLINHMGQELTYIRPNAEILDFLKVHKQNINGEYEYIGNPWVALPLVDFIDTINNNETKLLGAVPTTKEFHWPEMNPGNYYVGNTLKIEIEAEKHHFESRIYFTIK